MTLQNRVTPDGRIVDEPWRGTMMGNRGGRIHDPDTRKLLSRRWASPRWICCVLQFKERQRKVMGEGYTELFFLDEVNALSAGHRPCFECRRKDANTFADAWACAFGAFSGSRADAMDRVLHTQRVSEKPLIDINEAAGMPDGIMIKSGDGLFARKNGSWLQWSGAGYRIATSVNTRRVQLLTPAATIEILRSGYLPQWHESTAPSRLQQGNENATFDPTDISHGGA